MFFMIMFAYLVSVLLMYERLDGFDAGQWIFIVLTFIVGLFDYATKDMRDPKKE